MEILVRDIINKAQNTLEAAGIADSQVDSWLLAEFVFGITRAKYYANMQMTVDGKSAEKYNELVNQRAGHIPLQYLVGTQEFMGLTFKVNENVLIPRQDTELLVENVADCLGNGERTVLDMCTGSGCIAVSIDRLSKDSKVTAVDISEKALEVAQENNRFNNANVTFIQSDLFTNVTGRYDIIVSNPPYIRTDEIPKLMEEVKSHEPVMALDGMEDGLYFYKKICNEASDYLNDNGKIFFEIGYDQGDDVSEILRQNRFCNIEVLKDLSGNDRVVIARKE
ncbi:peptide chain release factor N(5)-glutamine methyltransferase [uncultured Eubacterium sp.]|uniref:peptide chain release factor N(5)-glutamine methyltransferase n=1 Tax=uncultured Eubacterium sp. TaxID=165185 RepID=UPI002806444E|nr:peptide chain release factor N(5)-glutamine methyltransferase [uncultured Eubacterium sp.]